VDTGAGLNGALGVDALAADGGIVRLRPVSHRDAAALSLLYARASPDSLRLRFFGIPGQHALEAEVTRLTRPASPEHDAVLAEQSGEVIGVASYERGSPAERQAEFAVFVDERQHGRGVGTLLLEHLAALARRQGVTHLTGEALAGNVGMLRVATDLSGRSAARYAGGVVEMGLATTVDEAALAAADARDRAAERASLRPLLAPRCVAVVGAGRAPGGIGHETLRAILEYGYTGSLYAVNPHTDTVAGVACLPTLRAVPERVDLAVIVVPAAAVADVLADAGAAGVRAAVVLSAGFAEAGPDGRQAQAELVRLARGHGIRLVGPNCLGLLNTDPALRLAATFAPVLPAPGGLALASQSGAVGVAVLDHATRTGAGVSTFVSLGNKADVSGNDLLAYWFDDPATTAVALYLESFGNPRRFARIVRALARRKPVLAVFSGRSVAGRRAGVSHTAAAASSGVAVDTLFAQAGVVRTDNLGDLLDAARMLADQPLPAGDRLAIIGNAGGVNVLAADAAGPAGLRVPELSPALRDEVRRLTRVPANPLDLGAGVAPATLAEAVTLVATSGEVDAVLVVVASTRANDVPGALTALADVADALPSMPIAVVALGASGATTLGTRRVPVFDLPERAVYALGKAAGYAAWRQEPLGAQPDLPGVDPEGARATVRSALARGGGWQPYPRVADLLNRYGIAHVHTVTAVGERAVVTAARRLGFPAVLKAADPALVHKSDAGAVKLNLGGPTEVVRAYRDIGEILGSAEPAVLVQPMARGQVELIAGIVHDPLFGSLVMAGLGGVHADLFADRAFRLVPMTDRDAGRMWRSLRAAPLLSGYRGHPPVDTAAVEDLLLRLGRLAEDLPEVAELDLNPVVVGPSGALVVDAKLRLAPVGVEPDPVLRQLRQP
jgi:acyl-CoA synthetase (NDP forming)/GNAT superfamily N-acetyltransferase